MSLETTLVGRAQRLFPGFQAVFPVRASPSSVRAVPGPLKSVLSHLRQPLRRSPLATRRSVINFLIDAIALPWPISVWTPSDRPTSGRPTRLAPPPRYRRHRLRPARRPANGANNSISRPINWPRLVITGAVRPISPQVGRR